jgi:ADP-heptose:LPS heptosyltransferase
MTRALPSFKKILVHRFDTIGDIILFSGVIDALYAEYPGVEIDVMVLDKMKYVSTILNPKIHWWPIAAEIHSGQIDPLYTGDLNYEMLEQVIRQVREKQYDLLMNPLFSQTHIGSYISRASAIPRRIGFSSSDNYHQDKVPRKYREKLPASTYTHTVDAEEWSPEITKNHLLLNAITRHERSTPSPRIYIPDKAFSWADQFIRDQMPGAGRRFAVLFPGAGHDFRSWPHDRFAGIATWLSDKKKIVPVLAGSTYDSSSLDTTCDAIRTLSGAEPLRTEFKPEELDRFAALLSRSDLYIGNDTGPMHMAAALGVPTIGLFGGGTWGRFHPYGKKCVVVFQDMMCYQCGWNCSEGHYHCVKVISADTVKAAVDHIFDARHIWQFGTSAFISNKDHSLTRYASSAAQYGRTVMQKAKKRLEKLLLLDPKNGRP